MKKTLLTLMAIAIMFSLQAQTVLFDNGPIINAPGGGFGGADLSHLHSGLLAWGAGHDVSLGFRVAEEFTVPQGEIWTIDSIIFYAYQTGSGLTSTINEVNFVIWNGSPGAGTSAVIAGDTSLNKLATTQWSNIYRTNSTDFMNTERPVMRNAVTADALVLTAGTYWVDWQTGGSTPSGPWVPGITITGQPVTGNALQYNPNNMSWAPLLDNNNAQGVPFILIGSPITSVNELYNNKMVSVFPNPFSTSVIININADLLNRHDNLSIVITDGLGKSVHQINNIHSDKVKMDRGNLSSGIYFYELRSNNTRLSLGKLMIN